jgi:predicted RNase H-like HicB family nuclease
VVTLPGHPGDDVPAGTLKSIQRAAGLEKTMSVRYAVIFEQAECNWAAYVPDLPGCITTGGTLEETERNIRQAIEGHLRTLREFGDSVPQSTSVARDIEIQPAA